LLYLWNTSAEKARFVERKLVDHKKNCTLPSLGRKWVRSCAMKSVTESYKKKVFPRGPDKGALESFFARKLIEFNQPSFITADPISVPHQFKLKQDIEIAAFFAAIFSWGNRKTIISKSKELMLLMSNSPFDFIINHQESDLKPLMNFRHRTFNSEDLFYFIEFLRLHYTGTGTEILNGIRGFEKSNTTLETAFTIGLSPNDPDIHKGLSNFYRYFFSIPDAPHRTRKHISTPEKKSACKRLNMFLRWMVRSDQNGVDFGFWKTISPSQLLCPLDVHVARVARHFGLLKRPGTDWLAAAELTENLRRFDPADPVKYDFVLFGLGAEERF